MSEYDEIVVSWMPNVSGHDDVKTAMPGVILDPIPPTT